jgi:hypothetical protein
MAYRGSSSSDFAVSGRHGPAELARELDNEHDPNAVAIQQSGVCCGYWNRGGARSLAKVLDSGVDLVAFGTSSSPPKVMAADRCVIEYLVSTMSLGRSGVVLTDDAQGGGQCSANPGSYRDRGPSGGLARGMRRKQAAHVGTDPLRFKKKERTENNPGNHFDLLDHRMDMVRI